MIVVRFRDVTISYGNHRVVERISSEVCKGEIFGIIGPNGAGKTTLLRALCGMIVPDEGEIWVNGVNPGKKNPKVAILFESATGHSFLRLTPEEDLEFYSALYGVDVSKSKIHKILKIVGLYEFKDRRLYTFSRGMWQRQYIARILLPDYPVIVLDEPWLGLDVSAQRDTIKLLNRLKEIKKTIILTAHEMPLIERVCDRILLLSNGKKVVEGRVERLLSKLKWRYEVSVVGDVNHIQDVEMKERGNYLIFFVKNLKEFLSKIDYSKINEINIKPISLEDAYISWVEGKMENPEERILGELS